MRWEFLHLYKMFAPKKCKKGGGASQITKKVCRRIDTLFCDTYLYPFYRFEASRADVTRQSFSVRNVAYLLNVCLKSPSRSSLRVADVVARRLSLSAYSAYSRHILHLRVLIRFF